MIKNSIIKEYKKNGVVVLRDIISKKWINILKNGVKKNFENPSRGKKLKPFNCNDCEAIFSS